VWNVENPENFQQLFKSFEHFGAIFQQFQASFQQSFNNLGRVLNI